MVKSAAFNPTSTTTFPQHAFRLATYTASSVGLSYFDSTAFESAPCYAFYVPYALTCPKGTAKFRIQDILVL